MIVLGLREGEVLGLRWSDINLEQSTLSVEQQYTQLLGRAHLSTTKTPYADRTLPFPRALAPVFERLLAQLGARAAREEHKGAWCDHGLLFPGRHGRPMNPSSLYHMLKRAAASAGLPASVTVHDLRHTAAKFYTDLGAPDVVRAALAGHSPKTITDHYGRPGIETLRLWVEQAYGQLVRANEQHQQEVRGAA